jgi:hypothetical protein
MSKAPSRVFLSLQPVGYKKPAGADPFTYQDKRPSRWRASWWTRGTSTEMYRSKIVATKEEAVRLALKWLGNYNKQYADRPEYMLVDTTDHPERYGYAHEPVAHATKKSPKQLDAEIAKALAKSSRSAPPSVVYLQTRAGQNHELSGRRLAKLRKDITANQGGPALTNFAASGYIGFVGPDGELWDLEALPDYLVGGL